MWGLGLTSKNKLFVKYTVETGTYRNSIKIFDNLIYENKLQTNYSKVESQKDLLMLLYSNAILHFNSFHGMFQLCSSLSEHLFNLDYEHICNAIYFMLLEVLLL